MTDPNPDDIATLFDPPADAVIETHISRVFLCGDRAFKLKRAVRLPYVDFSTLDLRRLACEREVELNRRTAPQLYLGCRAVCRDGAGRLVLDGGGAPVDWLVEMRRFAADATLDRALARDAVSPALIDALADVIAAFHAAAAPVDRAAGDAIAQVLALNDAAFAALPDGRLPPERLAEYRTAIRAELERQSVHLAARGSAGRMRRGHGDLHLRNIALIDGVPVLFDGLEFDESLASIDTLFDTAFLLMDLLQAGRRDYASRVMNACLDRAGDLDGAPLLPLYVAARAGIRCHIAALRPDGLNEARRYLDLGRQALRPVTPRLVAVGGFSGSGKTTQARLLAPDLGGPCGAVILRSDTIRKQLAGVAPTQHLPPVSYTPQSSRAVYAELMRRADRLLGLGVPVVLDAVFGQDNERAAVAALAQRHGCRFDGLWLAAPAEHLVARVAARRGDASDATPAVVRRQIEGLTSPADWHPVDTSGGPDLAAADIRLVLESAAPA